MNSIPPRIVGLENEYMAGYKAFDQNAVEKFIDPLDYFDSPLARLFPDDVPNVGNRSVANSLKRWLGNGSRYLIDSGNHWETTTPECASFADVVAYDMAGESYATDHLEAMVLSGLFSVVVINKRVSDHAKLPNTTGAHENYGVSSGVLKSFIESQDEATTSLLAAHLVTRAIYTGAGSVDYHGNFHVTQKLQDIEQIASNTATTKKALISLRDEGLSDGSMYSNRLHIVGGDANISPWATWMKVGTTSLVLRLIEHSMITDDLILEDPIRAADQVDYDKQLQAKLITALGEKTTAISFQEGLLESVRRLSARTELPEEELEVIEEWQEVLDDLRQDPDKCEDRIDWIARKRRIDAPTRRAFANDLERLKYRDIGYDLLSPTRGSGLSWRDAGGFRRTPTASYVDYCRRFPPNNTRANIRGNAVRGFARAGAGSMGVVTDWDKLYYRGRPFFMYDPYDGDLERFIDWIGKSGY